MFFIKTIICPSFFFFGILPCHGELNGPRVFLGTKWKDQKLGPRPHVGTWGWQSSRDRAQALWALPFGVRVPSASLLSLPCSLHHPRPSFPALCSRLVFPHHPHDGVLCVSALSEDPEAQFCVSLHQLPHRCETGRQALSSGRPPPWGGSKDRGGGWYLWYQDREDFKVSPLLPSLVSHSQAQCEDGYFITPFLWGFSALCTSS